MEIQNTAPIHNVSFKAQAAKTQSQNQTSTTTPIKDGNKKLKYALMGLAAVGVAAVAIGAGRHHNLSKATKAVQEAGQQLGEQAGKVAQEAAQDGQKAVEAVSETIQETVQKETIKTATPAITASERHLQQYLSTGEKASKSAQASASVFEEAFEKEELKNAQKALEAATGKKSGIVADEGYQQMYKDLARKQEESALLDLVTGKKSGKSAQTAASVFKHVPQSLNEKIADVCSYKGMDFTPNIKVEKKLRKMSPEAVKNLSHKDIMRLLETPNQPKATKIAINKLSQLEH